MLKNSLIRGISSFMYSVGIYVLLQFVLTIIIGNATGLETFIPILPEFAAHFTSPYIAVFAQTLLIGLTGAVFGAGSFIMELERLSLPVQSVLYLAVTMAVWVPVGCFCWGLHKYPGALVSVGLSYTIAYCISWGVQYRLCKKNIQKINQKLLEIREESGCELCN